MEKRDPKQLLEIERDSGGSEGVVALNLGQRVRDLRKACGWPLEQATQHAGLARSTLSKI